MESTPDCPSPRAGGRQDRCGLFAAPQRCLPGACTSSDAPANTAPEPRHLGQPPRAASDRRQGPRREVEQRLHLARELVLQKAKEVADAFSDPKGNQTIVDNRTGNLCDLVGLLRAAEEAARP